MIYLDNAATTMPKPDCVIEAVTKAMTCAGNAARGVNEASLAASRLVYEAREEIARLFGFSCPGRVCFSLNATEALNTAIQGLFKKGDHVITTAMEHNSVLRPLQRLVDENIISLTVLPADKKGRISIENLESAIRSDTKAMVLQHASNVTGNVTDLYKIGNICRKHGILQVVDAAQTAGVIPVSMEEMHIDVLCFTGHKGLMGPQGTGGILVGENVHIRPLKEGGSGMHSYDKRQPAVFPEYLEAGTLNVHGIAGLLAAVRDIRKSGTEAMGEKEIFLAREFYKKVRIIENIHFYGDFTSWEKTESEGFDRTGIVTLNIEGCDSGEVADELMERFGIATRSGAHCAPLAHKALGTVESGAVRFSFSAMNTREEVDRAAEAVSILAREAAEDSEP